MNRMNKTVGNLDRIWERLDNACGELENALYDLGQMANLPKEIQKGAEILDISEIVNLKNAVEQLIEEKLEKQRQDFLQDM